MSSIKQLAEPEYFFLYDTPFMGFQPPNAFFVFCLGPAVLYLLCVFVVWPFMSPRSKSAVLFVDKLRYWHNVGLSIYSAVSCGVVVYELVRNSEFGFWTFKIDDMKPYLCNEPTDLIKQVNSIFIWSKIYEMLDTAFIVWLKNDHARSILKEVKDEQKRQKMLKAGKSEAEITAELSKGRKTTSAAVVATTTANGGEVQQQRKKSSGELNFLHVYHHCTTFWLFLLCADLPSSTKGGPVFNGFVHTLMYLHYARPLPMPFLITIAQIGQLTFVTWCWYLSSTQCDVYKNSFMSQHWYEYLTPYFMVPVYWTFFVKFFVQRFIVGGGKKKEMKME